jgi:hypothetical protein
MKGPSNFFIHDTDTADESGPWGPWEGGELQAGFTEAHQFCHTSGKILYRSIEISLPITSKIIQLVSCAMHVY